MLENSSIFELWFIPTKILHLLKTFEWILMAFLAPLELKRLGFFFAQPLDNVLARMNILHLKNCYFLIIKSRYIYGRMGILCNRSA